MTDQRSMLPLEESVVAVAPAGMIDPRCCGKHSTDHMIQSCLLQLEAVGAEDS